MPSGQSACAVLLQDASFAWGVREGADEDKQADKAKQPSSASVRGWALAQSKDVLRDLSLAIPQGSLTAIVGDIGSGDESHTRTLRNEPHTLCIVSPARVSMPKLAVGRWAQSRDVLQEPSLPIFQGSLAAIGWETLAPVSVYT